MIPQAVKSALVLGVLTLSLALVGLWGWQAMTEPFPGKTTPAKCLDTSIAAGEKVFPDQVTVSIYNTSDRNGLAGRTMNAFADAGFAKGDQGNAPDDADVSYAAIWTTEPQNPDVRLVASRLGKDVNVVRREGRGVGVTVLVGNDFEDLAKGKRRVVAKDDATICSPPVN